MCMHMYYIHIENYTISLFVYVCIHVSRRVLAVNINAPPCHINSGGVHRASPRLIASVSAKKLADGALAHESASGAPLEQLFLSTKLSQSFQKPVSKEYTLILIVV